VAWMLYEHGLNSRLDSVSSTLHVMYLTGAILSVYIQDYLRCDLLCRCKLCRSAL